MHPRYRVLGQSQPERWIIKRLRAAASGTPVAEATAITTLAAIAIGHGLAILPPESPYLGSDEIDLLGRLALAQRRYGGAMGAVAPELRHMLDLCAAELDRRSLRLPYIAVQRPGFAAAVAASPGAIARPGFTANRVPLPDVTASEWPLAISVRPAGLSR